MGRVVVLGSINRDLVVPVARIPGPGETILGGDLVEFPGGKGANQAVAAARLGADVMLAGALGDDGFGRSMRAFLAGERIDLSRVTERSDCPTGIAMIAVAQNGENAIVVSPGANARVDDSLAEALPISTGDILLCQLEIPLASVLRGFERAKACSATTILNTAPIQDIPARLLELTDVLVLNEHELARLAGTPPLESEADIGLAMDRLRGTRPIGVVVTLGSRGVRAKTGGTSLSIPGEAVTAIDTTGAGDCFTGALAAGLAGGLALEGALRRANRAAALSVTRRGAATSMPFAHEIPD